MITPEQMMAQIRDAREQAFRDADPSLPMDPDGVGIDSYNRMRVVTRNFWVMPGIEWFEQLGTAWSGCDNIARWRPFLREILREATRAELDAMMTPEERTALAAMPEKIQVWRGCYRINRPGLSWTLSRDIAARFPTLARYCRKDDVPILRLGHVRRDRVVLKLDRNEQEIIAANVFGITEVRL
ncbi:MAG: hypothetical protein AB7G13_22375 [Lautropia sp.]